MASEFAIPSASASGEQPSDSIERGLDDLIQSVRKLVQETDSLKRLKDQLVIHARQVDFDVQRLRDLQKVLKAQLEATMEPPAKTRFLPVEQRFDEREPEPARDISPLSLSDTKEWNVIPEGGAYNKQNVKLRYALNMDSVLCTIRFNGDGSLFAFADGKNVFIMNSADGSLIGACQIPRTGHTEPHTRAIVFSPDSRLIALSGHDNNVIVIDVQSRRHLGTLEAHQSPVSSLAFLSDSVTLITADIDGMLYVWDVDVMKPKILVPYTKGESKEERRIMSLSVARDDKFIVVGFLSGSIGIYEKTFQQPPMIFTSHSEPLFSVTVSPQGLIGTASHDKTAKVWRVSSVASCKKVLEGHTDLVLTVAFAPEEPIVFTGSKDESIKCWNYETGENLFTLTGHKNTVFQIDHHPTAKTIVSCSGEGLVCVWDYSF